MSMKPRSVYTPEYKLEAVRQVKAGESISTVSKVLGVPHQTLFTWVKLEREVKLVGPGSKAVNPEKMEIARHRAENARLKMERDVLKKSHSVLCQGNAVKYAWIRANQKDICINISCAALGVRTSGYHEHQRGTRPLSKRISTEQVLTQIRSVHAQVKQEYGWPMMWHELQHRGVRVGKERVRKLMEIHGIRARTRRRFKITTDSKHQLPVALNLLQRDFTPLAPDRTWTSDITYIDTAEGWLFLTVILDLYSRRIVGFAIDSHMRRDLVLRALRMAWFRRHPAKGLIMHTDRGSQYCSDEFQTALKAYGMRSSMSRKGDCWDNAPTESLWSRLKTARVYGKKFSTRQQGIDEVMNWIHFYNAKRLHSTLNYVSPMQFEEKWHAARPQCAA